MKIRLPVKLYLKIVFKVRDIFTKINDIKYDLISVIIKVISTELMITKRIHNISLIKVLAADDSGMINILFKNDFINYAKINKELILRNAKIEEINGHIYIVCDELCSIFESSNLIDISSDSLKINFSEIKINKLEFELF